jgi:hypothetical protein
MSGSRAGVAIHEELGVIASDVLELAGAVAWAGVAVAWAGVAAWAGAATAQRPAIEMRHF